MKGYIERTEELVLAVNAGARAIENNKRYHGTTYCIDVFSNNPREIPYLKAAEVLRSVDKIPAADVVSKAAFDQVLWERDVAIQQLREDYGVGLGEKKSADVVERKRGEWIEVEFGWDDVYYDCSVCGESFCLIDGTPTDNMYNFCPSCGSDMRSHQNILCDQAEAELTR